MSLVDEHELMSLVYSEMIASLEDTKETSLGWEKLVAQRKTAEMARVCSAIRRRRRGQKQ